jgi:putative tryptophan/tyrosine transport system substrate-binding protein
MRRRDFITLVGGAAAWPAIAKGQQRANPVVGFLNGASYSLSAHLVRAFHQGLGETGFVEGRNVAFDYRSAEGRYATLPALAADLVSRRVDVIAATGTPAGLPAKAATTSIPIVFVTGSDPVQQGLVPNLHRPGGNLTGATTLAVEMGQKRLQLLHELVPHAKLIGALINPVGPNVEPLMQDLKTAASTLRLSVHVVHASAERDFDPAFAELSQKQAGALLIGTDTFFNSQSAKLGALTLRKAMPAVYQYREFAAAGGLMSFGGSIADAYRVAGVYTGRILKGERPADLPVQQSAKAELFINLRTAKALGLTVPSTLLARADEVID